MPAPTTAPDDLPLGTVERWAADYVLSEDLSRKLAPPPAPRSWLTPSPPAIRLTGPGRPPELDLRSKTRRSVPFEQLRNPRKRAQLLHTFCHHELQAAELMCWALLAFPDTPLAFRRGLLHICHDEIRHMGLYRAHITTLGFALGDFPVRDWFWQRVASCATPLQFVALLGLGFEGGNLDHTRRFAAWFRAVDDHAGAELQDRVGDEEVAHVRFAMTWFQRWSPAADFDAWRRTLVAPLTPTMMKGDELDDDRRRRAGFPAEFLAALRAWDAP